MKGVLPTSLWQSQMRQRVDMHFLLAIRKDNIEKEGLHLSVVVG
jgi:hypothetical protein